MYVGGRVGARVWILELWMCIPVRLSKDMALYTAGMAALIVGWIWMEEVQGFVGIEVV